MSLNELSNIELLSKIMESDEELGKELLSRIELCVCEYTDENAMLNHSYFYCNTFNEACAAVREKIKNDGDAFGYLHFGTYKAPRECGVFYWED